MPKYSNPPNQSKGILDDYAVRKVVQTREHRVSNVWHVYGGFEDKTTTVTLAADTYAQVTNITNDLFELKEVNGITLTNDQLTIENTADYSGSLSISLSAIAGKDFHFRIYNVTQARVEGFELGVSTTGAANKTLFSMPIYLEATKGDVFEFQVKSIDGTDAVLSDSVFYINYLHE